MENNNKSDFLDNDMKSRIRFLVRTYPDENYWQKVIYDLLDTYYGVLSKKEKLVCEWILYTVWDTCFSNAPYIEVVDRLKRYCNDSFLEINGIENTINKLSIENAVEWMVLLNPVESEKGEFLRIHKWETLNLKPKMLQKKLITAMGHTWVEALEFQEERFPNRYANVGPKKS